MFLTFIHDANDNMTARTIAGVAYAQKFDVENRLETVTVGGRTTRFVYDADGNRLLTIQHDGVRVYTPFPEFEETVAGATVTQRSYYYLAGQLIAARVKTPTTDATYYAYADHLGSIVAWSWTGGTPPVNDYRSRYEPFGGYRTEPATTVNPDISDRGFTGHKQNNTGRNRCRPPKPQLPARGNDELATKATTPPAVPSPPLPPFPQRS